jgi:hypothetical protein
MEAYMSFVLLILIILAVFITLLFVVDINAKLLLDTDKIYMKMTLLWLYPFLKVSVLIEDNKPVLNFFIFKKYVFKKHLQKSKSKLSTLELLKIINPKNICINTSYGFINPSTTGITCGAINVVSQFINIESMKHNPDFMTISDYIYLDATANINLGMVITSLITKKTNRRNLSWIRTQT